MDESFLAKILHFLVFVGICAAIIITGWSEPLRYRFMSTQEIEVAEGRSPEDLAAAQRGWMPSRTRLEEPSHTRTGAGTRSSGPSLQRNSTPSR